MDHQNTEVGRKKQNADDSKHNQNWNCFLYIHQHRDGSALHVILLTLVSSMKEKIPHMGWLPDLTFI